MKAPVAGLLALAALSCGTKGDVTVNATIGKPMVSVTGASALAVGLSGTFTMHVELGQFSPSGTDITSQAWSLQPDASVSPFQLDTVANPASPIHLEPGQSADVVYTVTDGSTANAQVIPAQQAAQICGAAMAQIHGTLSDTASGGSTRVDSAFFLLTGSGCPH